MKRNKVLVILFVCLLGFAAVWLLAGRSAPAEAQSDGEFWNSSSEVPEGMDIENLSPPDSSNVNPLLQEEMEGGGLVSWRVTGSTLKPRENNVSYGVDSNGSCVYITGGSAFTVWNIPVQLENGSRVDTLRMYYYDTSASNTTAWFTIYDLYGAIVQEWAVSSNTSGGNSFNDSDQINHTVDYSVYSYVLNWRPVVSGSSIQLCGFRVFYEPVLFNVGYIPAVLNP